MLRPIYRKWLSAEILSGRIDARFDDEKTFQHRWIAPKSEFLDPLKDANAAAVLLAAGLTSRREVCAALGISVEDLDAQIASDRAREAALGLSFPPQPNRRRHRNKESPMARHKHQPRHFLREAADPLFERSASIGPSSINEADRSFEMVFATDALIGGHRLAITPENVSKATGVSLFDSHNRSSLSNVIGVVGETSIVGNEARARVRMSARADALWQDVKAGIIRGGSVG